jgi:hypothetical protein
VIKFRIPSGQARRSTTSASGIPMATSIRGPFRPKQAEDSEASKRAARLRGAWVAPAPRSSWLVGKSLFRELSNTRDPNSQRVYLVYERNC